MKPGLNGEGWIIGTVSCPESLNPGGIPRRQVYPSFEATLNKQNYEAAVNRMGGTDDLNSRVWWDK